MNTVVFVNAIIGFPENLFLVSRVLVIISDNIFTICVCLSYIPMYIVNIYWRFQHKTRAMGFKNDLELI